MNQEKIVIIGGGVSAMTAALYLTEQPDWQQHRTITVGSNSCFVVLVLEPF